MHTRFPSGAIRAVVLSFGIFIGLAAAGPVDSFAASVGSSGIGFSYIAAPGEANTVTVSYAQRVFTITDSTAAITPALGCSAVTAHQVTCDNNNGFSESTISFTIDTGDMNDSVTVVSAPVGTSPNQISGGDGADTLTGGPEIDALDDGAGNDTVNGGAGDDVL